MCVQDVDVQCVLQFTLINAAGCALHRRTSRVIHRIELYSHPRGSTWFDRHAGATSHERPGRQMPTLSLQKRYQKNRRGSRRLCEKSPRCDWRGGTWYSLLEELSQGIDRSLNLARRLGRYPTHQVWNGNPSDGRRAAPSSDAAGHGARRPPSQPPPTPPRGGEAGLSTGCPGIESLVALHRTSFGNDPSAGSPTETLLRLLLPLDSQV